MTLNSTTTTPEFKKCGQCNAEKKLSDFYTHTMLSGNTHIRKHCIQCVRAYRKQLREAKRGVKRNKYEKLLGDRYEQFKNDLRDSTMLKFDVSKKYDISYPNIQYFMRTYL